MNKLVKRGIDVYKIFLKNKIAMSLMMLFSGIMMFIAAINGHGNDTKTMPLMITLAGAGFSFWSLYRLGCIKSDYDKIDRANRGEREIARKGIFLHIGESLIYVIIAVVGIFLLINESFTNKVLNLMAGGFTTFNGILGAINTYKNRNNKNFRWKFMLGLTIVELIIGPIFIFAPSIDINGYIIMGALTTIAGTIEVISAFTMDNIKSTVRDGKDIVRIMKENDKKPEE
ncbi:MAG: DUF308 domain-containing protein [Candidatus Saccharibacteria bacterium]|nr:DUF308 domain-containing protein [Candidatus Saccharibacteria bacterium]